MSADNYFLPVSQPRPYPVKCEEPRTLALHRWNEHNTATSFSLEALLPGVVNLNEELDQKIKLGEPIEWDELSDLVLRCSRGSFIHYSRSMLVVATQTAVASALTYSSSAAVHSTVYLWDISGSIFQMCGHKLLDRVHLPRYFVGSKPVLPSTLAFATSNVSLGAVFEDSIKRKVIFAAAESIVTVATEVGAFVCGMKKKLDVTALSLAAVKAATLLVSCSAASVAGFLVGGNTCEYFADIIATLSAPTLALTLYSFASSAKRSGKERSSKRRTHR